MWGNGKPERERTVSRGGTGLMRTPGVLKVVRISLRGKWMQLDDVDEDQ